ncbi:helix-turn-helix transcriptional regulator [Streptomyces gilvus]|uniref:helix-turn-helix transcriptional regulator n=1 Tax=Streptomyces gilvus TaxID=2920937 RepID=UPI001F109FF2|nr:helix-turn-helix transcriptional regulator [Streptomyces sp. CME 23]MCH5675584.1 helix-turn-helix transcriptional regulator [Streptomyces sp. CME 23]
MASDADKRPHELAAFLRARRSQVRPESVGLAPADRPRRVPGLRREEVANLSRVSYSWYTRLEQGQNVHATVDVIDSIAAALRLTEDEHRHMRRLAGLPPGPYPCRDNTVDEHARQLLERLLPAPAYVLGPTFDYLAWNDALVAVFCDIGELQPPHRNVLWATFNVPRVRSSLAAWEEHARSVIGQFRAEAAAHPSDPRFSRIADELAAANADFQRWWAAHEVVRGVSGRQEFLHKDIGCLSTYLMQLRLIDRPSLKVVVHLPATPDDARKLEIIRGQATWGAVIGH